MKKTQYSSLGIDINLSVPAEVAEFDANAGKPNACLDEAINNVVYRGMLADFRYFFLHGISQADLDADKEHKQFAEGTTPIEGVEESSGIARKTVAVLDKSGNPVKKDGEAVTNFDPEDSEAKYFKRVCAEKGVEPASFQSLADKVASALVFDASASERKAVGPKKLAAKYKEKAAKIIALGSVDALAAKFKTLIGRDMVFTPSGDMTKTIEVTGLGANKDEKATVSDKDAEALGWLAKEYTDAYAAQGLDQVV